MKVFKRWKKPNTFNMFVWPRGTANANRAFCSFTTKLHRAPLKHKPGNNLQPHGQDHHRAHTLHTNQTYGCVRVRVGSWLEKEKIIIIIIKKNPVQMLTDVLQEFGCCICHPAAERDAPLWYRVTDVQLHTDQDYFHQHSLQQTLFFFLLQLTSDDWES